jgi:3-phosphoshikimate 1-carboxyvinyltransferase
MEKCLTPSQIGGTITAPSSKSMTQRAIAAAILADGESVIINPSFCDDSIAAMGIARGLGAKVEASGDKLKISGCGELKEKTLNCGESGLAIRMFSPVAALCSGEITITGSGSLKNRPMFMIGDALKQLGVEFTSTNGYLPLTIKGPLQGGSCEIDGSISSQLLTGLLMALPVAVGDSQIKVRNLKSKPYIDMTLSILRDFGIEAENDNYELFSILGGQRYMAGTYRVESDWSGGAFLLVAGAIGGSLTVRGLRIDSSQSDKFIITALKSAGADINISENKVEITKSSLKAFEFDATESPDLFPPLVALASYCEGTSRIGGASRLRHKESDRATALIEEFAKMNISVVHKDDFLIVTGGEVRGANVNSHGDHRIAMATAIAALSAKGRTCIKDSGCVAKSYPGFFKDLRKIGAEISD